MVLYFIKSTFLLLIFCLIFKWNLENKKSLQFIRYYLLASIVFALVVPLFNFQFLVPKNKIVETKEYIFNQLPSIPVTINSIPEKNISILAVVYVFVSSVFLIRFLYNLIKILRIKGSGKKVNTSFGNLIVSNNVTSPFTFCNYIYVNKTEWENKSVNHAILFHEQAHVIQNHSIDILFIEVIKVILWFQPFLYYFKKNVQENHEYLADEFSLQRTNNLQNYQELILNYYGNNQPIVALSSSIHFNNLKKRFIMMKNTNRGKVWGTIFYSFTVALAYVGFVGIEAKASDIKKIENKVSNVIEESVKQSDEIMFTEPIGNDAKNEIKNDSIILAYIKGEKSSGYFNHKGSVYFYTVDESLKVSIYNRYGVVQNEKDFSYELKVVSKSEKEKLTLGELKRSSQLEKDYQAKKEQEKSYAEAYSFVEKKATPKEGLAPFMQNFAREFKAPKDINSDEIKMRLKFIVETDGRFSNIVTLQEYFKPDEAYLSLQEEAIRTLKTMPNWKPAEHEEEIVRSTFTLPITIRVNPIKIDVVN